MRETCREKARDFFEEVSRQFRHGAQGVREAVAMALKYPAPSYYLEPATIERFYYEVEDDKKAKRKSSNSIREACHKQISEIVSTTGVSIREAAEIVSTQPAPGYFVTENRGRMIYYEYLWRRKKKPRTRQ
jgi:hypothetical protein